MKPEFKPGDKVTLVRDVVTGNLGAVRTDSNGETTIATKVTVVKKSDPISAFNFQSHQ